MDIILGFCLWAVLSIVVIAIRLDSIGTRLRKLEEEENEEIPEVTNKQRSELINELERQHRHKRTEEENPFG